MSSLGQLQLLVGKGELQPHTLASFLQQGGGHSVCLGVYYGGRAVTAGGFCAAKVS